MTIFEIINKDLKDSMKSKDIEKRDFIKVVKADLQRISKNPSNEECLKVIKKLIKYATENSNQFELDYLNRFLPKLMSEDEIGLVVTAIIADGADNLGKIMGIFNKQFKGKADNNIVRKVAEELLK